MKNVIIEGFRFSAPVNIRWNDMDGLGHVNNVYYFEYFQDARGVYMIEASPGWNWRKNMFVIAHLECDYLRELTYQDIDPVVRLRVSSLSNKSFEFEYLITSTGKDGADVIHARGRSVQVMVDMTSKKSVEIPEWLRTEVTAYEPAL